MAANASELFREMRVAILRSARTRQVSDGASPQKRETMEATPGRSFTLNDVAHNFVDCRPVDQDWAAANVIHFFADTEDGSTLLAVNKRASEFIKDGKWEGAYGAIAMPQLRRCVEKLKAYPDTRRAVVSMGGLEHDDANRPACWSYLQFLSSPMGVDMCVYQRSLNLYGVMPYDCILLCNVLHYVASAVDDVPDKLHWCVGSLHAVKTDIKEPVDGDRNHGMLFKYSVLNSADECRRILAERACYGLGEDAVGTPRMAGAQVPGPTSVVAGRRARGRGW